ncbi:hypothetical protein RD792_005927 [Penstemon davidsonii]|uniref:Protein kinase domain-containing protein n=1 Tax=Penstemon davidsonii TaxID=160366 RepID=A0ABR0DEH1_9LAMI|nr:hypothetical protein RD792_005927 [Penstemon davidsonii]
MENGYVKGRYAGPRRSTGQRPFRQESRRNTKPESRNGNVKEGNVHVVMDGERKSISSHGDENNGNVIERVDLMNKSGDDELVDGWPKWLTDTIPKKVLKNIVLKSADSYVKIDKVKCYMHQLLSGLQHCHERGILHRDIKGSNLLIDRNGMLKIADFGLGAFFNPQKKRPLTSRVVTLWYRAPELLLASTDYGVGIDLWSAGCLMAEMFEGRPIMPGRTEVEQLHRIFKLCGTPPDDYYKRLKLSTALNLQNHPMYRGTAASALQNEFFYTSPLACDLSGLPTIHIENDDDQDFIKDKRK